MKISVKPSLLLLCSFILGYISLFLPGTIIQYQVLIGGNQPNVAAPQIVTNEGYARFFGDKYGADVIPCSFYVLESIPDSVFRTLYLIWTTVGRLLLAFPLLCGHSYVVKNKISLWKYFALAVILMVGPVLIVTVFSPKVEPMCNREDWYRIISFTPYWPTLMVLVLANLLGYHANRSINDTIKKILPIPNTVDGQ